MVKRTVYYNDPPVISTNIGSENAYHCTIEDTDVASIAGEKELPAGIFLCKKPGGHRPLPRSLVLAPYTAGETQLIVETPHVFKAGDVLRVIGTPGQTRYEEELAVKNATAPLFGTVTGVNALNQKQITTVTFASVAVGNVFTITVNDAPISFIATAASNQNVADGLVSALTKAQSGSSVLSEIQATAPGGVLTLTTRDPGYIFTVSASVAQGTAGTTGTATVAVTQPIGAITITPQGGAPSLAIGAKVGTIGDVIVGVLDKSVDFSNDNFRSIAPYSAGLVYEKALPYLDGDIRAQLPKLTFTP